MKIIHRISVSSKNPILDEIRKMNIAINSSYMISTFEISEEHEQWTRVQALSKEAKAVDLAGTLFTEEEIASAQWLVMRSTCLKGYPMPDMDFGYLELTYDLSEYNPSTGVGCKQKAPFRMQSEPSWGKNSFFQLNWVFDEFFTKPEIWEKVFKSMGIECLDVLKHRTDSKLDTVVQLIPQEVAKSPLKLSCHDKEVEKYPILTRGFFPGPVMPDQFHAHYFHSQEYFGSGGSANKAVIVSQQFARTVKCEKLKGVSFIPMK